MVGAGPFGEGEKRGADDRGDGALGARVEFADGFDSVTEEFDAHGPCDSGEKTSTMPPRTANWPGSSTISVRV